MSETIHWLDGLTLSYTDPSRRASDAMDAISRLLQIEKAAREFHYAWMHTPTYELIKIRAVDLCELAQASGQLEEALK